MRRVALGFAVLFTLVVTGAVTLVSRVAAAVGGAPLAIDLSTVAAIAFAVVVVGFIAAMRRVGLPFTDVVSAASRVADGDYSVRVAEHGPRAIRSVAQAFNRMTAQLQSQDEQRRNLMADIAHELRTPLTVMQGQLEGLLDGVYARDDQRLTEVLEQARLLARLVEDLRTLAHAERGTLALRREPVDLRSVAEDTAAGFANEAAARSVTIRVADHAELPPIDADPLRLREVLNNLVSNAVRHTAAGGTVTIAFVDQSDRVAVSVSDTGEGIAPDALPRIFERFYKGPHSSGSGLGLTIARNLVIAHGGEIVAESRVGVGTTITVTLPRSLS
jgi:signal transduction histidine kinase